MKKIDKAWDKWLMKLWGLCIHNRDKGCQWCGKADGTGKMDAHHYFHRRAKGTRWDKNNGIKLCFYCHNYRILQDPESLRTILILKIGLKSFTELYEKFKNPVKYINYEDIELNLTEELKKLKVAIPSRPKKLEPKD